MNPLADLEKEIELAKRFRNTKLLHKGEWIGLGYANFLVRLYKARSKK